MGIGSEAETTLPLSTPSNIGSQNVSLADFMDSGILDSKSEKIMQVDGMDTESWGKLAAGEKI